MVEIPLLWQGNRIGELLIQKNGFETLFTTRCSLPTDELWNVWAVGDAGELRLGMPVLTGRECVLEKRFSHRMTDPLGQLRYGELRSCCKQNDRKREWKSVGETKHIRTEWMRRQLQAWPEILCSCAEKEQLIAIPYVKGMPFPLMPFFCFAQLQMVCGRIHLVIKLNEYEQPIF